MPRLLVSQPDINSPLSDDSPQTKRCSLCQRSLNADSPPLSVSLYTPESSESASYCSVCREVRLSPRPTPVLCPTVSAVESGACDIDVPRRVLRDSRTNSIAMHVDRHGEGESSSSDEDTDLREEARDAFVADKTFHTSSSVSQGTFPVPITVSASPLQQAYPQRNTSPLPNSRPRRLAQPRSPVRQTYPSPGETHSSHRQDSNDGYPDPLVDITRLRVRSKGYKCLQPGATFKGTQKSGRNSYDVNVTIVDVDFASSFLCGYLRIRGLTDDWPELTTYFDAQIIGMRHGFDTQDWGASRQEDMVHWARFPAFRAVQKELIEPRLLLPANTSRPAVFMRWKERFLVPDHRVQDISGASFAGFYYVCVDFDPEPPSTPPSVAALLDDLPTCIESGYAPYQNRTRSSIPQRPSAPEGMSRRKSGRDESGKAPAASMCGFYYHKNSEPYQQLSLMHVEKRFYSSSEFR